MQTPLVNVIMPAYNAQDYIQTALKSVMAQDYPNIKIYVVNDCSTDNTLSVINSTVNGDQRVTVIDLKQNGGPTHARNCALDVIEGEFFTFVDSDDKVEPNHISSLMQLMSDDCVLATSCIKQQKRTNKNFKSQKEKIFTYDIENAKIEVVGDKTFSAFSCSKIFRRSVCGELRFAQDVPLCEDTVFCLEYLAKAQGKVVYSTKRTYHYFRTKGSLSGLSCNQNKFDKLINLKQKVYQILQSEQNNLNVALAIKAWWFLMQLQFVLYAKNLKNKDQKKQFILEAENHKKYFKARKKTFGAPYRRYGGVLFALMKIFL